MIHSILLLPFLIAFITFALRFYFRENAASMANPSFLMAFGTVLVVVLYLALGVLGELPPYSTVGFSLVGLALLGVSIMRLFII